MYENKAILSLLHILITTVDNPECFRLVYADLPEKEFKKKFLKPYQKNSGLLVGGEVIRITDIRKVRVIRTNNTFQNECDLYVQKVNIKREKLSRSGPIFFLPHSRRDYDILNCGIDITSDLIKTPPGQAPFFITLTKWIGEHVTQIAIAILIAIAIALLGIRT